jgi:hypothetical protein
MINWEDRQPTQLGRRKITHEDGTSEYVTVEMADQPTNEGTPLNRYNLMAMQGFIASTTEFLDDGSIKETNSDGDILLTEFLEDGSIKSTFTPFSRQPIITKTTVFNDDGSITTEVV